MTKAKNQQLTARQVAEAFVKQANNKVVDLTSIKRAVANLAQKVTIDSFDASEQAITVEKDRFSGEGVVYLILKFPEDVVLGEELPVSFRGHLTNDGTIAFDDVGVDQSTLESISAEQG